MNNFKYVLTGLLAAATVFVPSAVLANSGQEPIQYKGPGTPGANQVMFNNMTNVPNIGDERNFLHGQVVGTGEYSDPVNAKVGDEVLVRVYVHNNADSSTNDSGKGVAKNTKVKVTLPTASGNNLQASATVSASNATPKQVTDTINIKADNNFSIDYVEGSARIRTNFMDKSLSDNLVAGGTLIGHDNLNGDMNGCFEYAAYVTFKVKLVEKTPKLKIAKFVRFDGQTSADWKTSITAKPGDVVEYKIAFDNVGNTQIDDLIVGDDLPNGMSYVKGTDKVINSLNAPSGESLADQITSVDVKLLDRYNPGVGAIVVYKAKIDALADKCGKLTLTNNASARTASTNKVLASADVVVDTGKSCTTPVVTPPVTTTPQVLPTTTELPNTGPASVLGGLLGTGSIAVAVRNWLGSRKALKTSFLSN